MPTPTPNRQQNFQGTGYNNNLAQYLPSSVSVYPPVASSNKVSQLCQYKSSLTGIDIHAHPNTNKQASILKNAKRDTGMVEKTTSILSGLLSPITHGLTRAYRHITPIHACAHSSHSTRITKIKAADSAHFESCALSHLVFLCLHMYAIENRAIGQRT